MVTKGLTSIIVTCKVRNKTEAHMSMACIANIIRYTDLVDYELIIVNPAPTEAIRDDYKVFPDPIWIEPKEDPGYTAGMNLGAKVAKGEFLCFIQNDVFVHEGWLKNLRYYLENNLTDCIIPDQMPREREFVLKSYDMSIEEGMKYGSRDEGLWMMTRKAYDLFEGFNEDLSLLHARDFYTRFNEKGLRINDTCKVMISHICGASNWNQHHFDREGYDARMGHDAKILNG